MRKNIKNYAFIDSQNLNLGVRSQGWRLDFQKFRILLKDKYKVEKAFLFIGFIDKNKNLYQFLSKSGFKIIFKPTVEYKEKSNKQIKENIDAELVLHTMIQLPNFKKAIVVSGDGDFHCLLEYLEGKNKLFKVVIPNQKKYSSLLLVFKPYMIFMNYLKDKLKQK